MRLRVLVADDRLDDPVPNAVVRQLAACDLEVQWETEFPRTAERIQSGEHDVALVHLGIAAWHRGQSGCGGLLAAFAERARTAHSCAVVLYTGRSRVDDLGLLGLAASTPVVRDAALVGSPEPIVRAVAGRVRAEAALAACAQARPSDEDAVRRWQPFLAELELALVRAALRERDSVERAAAFLGVRSVTLRNRLAKLALPVPRSTAPPPAPALAGELLAVGLEPILEQPIRKLSPGSFHPDCTPGFEAVLVDGRSAAAIVDGWCARRRRVPCLVVGANRIGALLCEQLGLRNRAELADVAGIVDPLVAAGRAVRDEHDRMEAWQLGFELSGVDLRGVLDSLERQLVRELLAAVPSNREAARAAGLPESTFRRLRKRLGT